MQSWLLVYLNIYLKNWFNPTTLNLSFCHFVIISLPLCHIVADLLSILTRVLSILLYILHREAKVVLESISTSNSSLFKTTLSMWSFWHFMDVAIYVCQMNNLSFTLSVWLMSSMAMSLSIDNSPTRVATNEAKKIHQILSAIHLDNNWKLELCDGWTQTPCMPHCDCYASILNTITQCA